jgi:hypothetical protein
MSWIQSLDRADGIGLLQPVVERWAACRLASSKADLGDLVSPDFDEVDLLNEIVAPVEVDDVTVEPPSVVRVYFHDSTGERNRAEFVGSSEREWKLRALKFQCPVCFGTGTNDDAPCIGCGGIGWGAGP